MILSFVRLKHKELFFKILFSSIYFLIIVKISTFSHLNNVLRKQNKSTKEEYTLNTIINYEKFISKKLNINQCLIRMSVIFSILKSNGYQPKLSIGVNNDNQFKSHAWVDVNNLSVDLEKKGKYKTILEIK